MKAKGVSLLRKLIGSAGFSEFLFKVHRKWVARKFRAFKRFFDERLVDPLLLLEVPEFDGKFYIGKESDLLRAIAGSGGFESGVAELVSVHIDKSRDAIDIGANVGFYSILIAKRLRESGRVMAIEPDARANGLLASNIAINGVRKKVLVERVALASDSGTRAFYFVPGKPEYSSLAPLAHPAVVGLYQQESIVQCETVDALVAKHGLKPGFIKIDAEGSEHEILHGAEKTIERHRPTIILEVSARLLLARSSSPVQVVSFLRSHGYSVQDAQYVETTISRGFEGNVLATPER